MSSRWYSSLVINRLTIECARSSFCIQIVFDGASPMNGDFHFVAHVVAAVHNLYFLPFTAWIVEKIGFDKVIKLNDDNVTNFKHFDHFYLLLTLAIMTLLSDMLDPALLSYSFDAFESSVNNKNIFFC